MTSAKRVGKSKKAKVRESHVGKLREKIHNSEKKKLSV